MTQKKKHVALPTPLIPEKLGRQTRVWIAGAWQVIDAPFGSVKASEAFCTLLLGESRPLPPKGKRTPKYGCHKARGLARVRIDGEDIYLGEHGSQESLDEYRRLALEWLQINQLAPQQRSLQVDELVLRYLEHADRYYVKNGKPTSEPNNIRVAARHLIRLYGSTYVRDFGPKALCSVRESFIASGYVRTSTNRMVGRLKRLFKWGVGQEIVPVNVFQSLQAVTGLRRGRSDAVEAEPVKPAPKKSVKAIKPYVSRQVWAMIQLQLLTGMRPGEVRTMRGRDIQMTGDVWEYRPKTHKTEHHGKSRLIFIGPKAQKVLQEFIKPNQYAYLFSPKEARKEHLAKRKASRKTPMTPSQKARKNKSNPKRQPGEQFTSTSYCRAITVACKKADVPAWSPGQLRHNAATTIRGAADIDTARTVLGHGAMQVTEVYAERDEQTAREIIARIG